MAVGLSIGAMAVVADMMVAAATMAEIVATMVEIASSSFIPELMLTVAISADGSFTAVANKMLSNGQTVQHIEYGETKDDLIEWLDRHVHQPTRQ